MLILRIASPVSPVAVIVIAALSSGTVSCGGGTANESVTTGHATLCARRQDRFRSREYRSQSSDDLEESSDDLEKSSEDVHESLAVLMVLSHDRIGLPADVEKSNPVRFLHRADGFRSRDDLWESKA
jgi:hypothetical protein